MVIEGRLGYNRTNNRYGLLVMDLWENDGFHCGESMEVMVNGEWVPSRMEMARDERGSHWYLVNTPFRGDLEFVKVRLKND